MLVTKADGTREVFKPGKLRASLRRAGASKSEIISILKEIEQFLYDGINTQQIYSKAFQLLRDSGDPVAARYSLRRALFGLGPTGFPFEDFLARLFEADGYKTRTRTIVKGKCATHEIDVAGFTPKHSFIAEAKFHMRPGIKSDLQVALYSHARYLDMKRRPVCKEDVCGIDDLYIITNTKFTKAAVDYAHCVGLKLLSWNHPKDGSLHHRIEKTKLYPVTVLPSLSNRNKQDLLAIGVILCRDILKKPEILAQNGVKKKKAQAVIEEARQLCSI